MSTTILPVDDLIRFSADVLESLGVPRSDALLVSASLVTADIWGHPSHGMLRLDWYVARLRAGVMNPISQVETVVDTGPLIVLDGHDGIGQIVTDVACTEAVNRAKTFGVGVVAVRNSNHFGTAAYWTRRIAAEGCVGILTTNASPAMAPWGGREKTVGANPWSIATPGGSHGPAVLDIANTNVARGKIYAALQRGEEIPYGWAIDEEGAPTNDPAAAIKGILLPMGGHKGYAISFMMDVLSGVLTGSNYATGVVGPHVSDERSGCGHLIVAIDVDQVIGTDEFNTRIDDLIALTKGVALAKGAREIFYPGEIENRAEARGFTTGVALPAKTVDELRELAASCGLTFPLSAAKAS